MKRKEKDINCNSGHNKVNATLFYKIKAHVLQLEQRCGNLHSKKQLGIDANNLFIYLFVFLISNLGEGRFELVTYIASN
jgi:hypothetical protein